MIGKAALETRDEKGKDRGMRRGEKERRRNNINNGRLRNGKALCPPGEPEHRHALDVYPGHSGGPYARGVGACEDRWADERGRKGKGRKR